MRVKLKVAKGASAGKIFEVKVPQFIIGRSSGCQLRPQSDAISRQHCVIMVREDAATIRDLKSRNGTIVNGEKIRGEHTLVCGDEIRVGPLHLEVVVLDKQGDEVKTTREDAKEQPVAAKSSAAKTVMTAKGLSKSDNDNITNWLMDDDSDVVRTDSKVETRQFKIDETEVIDIKKAEEEVDKEKEEREEEKERVWQTPHP